jgi:hypothetical protein
MCCHSYRNSDEDTLRGSVMRAVRKQYQVSLTLSTSRNVILTRCSEAGVHKSRAPGRLNFVRCRLTFHHNYCSFSPSQTCTAERAPEVKQLGREDDHLGPPGFEAENEWSYFPLPHLPSWRDRDKFIAFHDLLFLHVTGERKWRLCYWKP